VSLLHLKLWIGFQALHYPEVLRKMYIINAPSIFGLFWKIIKPMMDPVTAAKVVIQSLPPSNKNHFEE
jgi:ABC-type glycerol-3-phosphate transport system permease component